MRVRRLDATGEPVFGQGKNDYLVDEYAVAQVIITHLKLFLGEWWEDITQGVPWWEEIMGQVGTKKEVIDRILQKSILDTTGVKNITYLDTGFYSSTGEYFFYCQVDTIYGAITITNNQGGA